jgi:UDP-GlcNAc:undecaprenyl-phosphate GlcNAc-1-phosphate transferase
MPYFGGLAMLVGVGVAFLVASRLPFLSSHAIVTRDSVGVFLAACVICLVGAIDDMLDLPVYTKVFGQVLAAAVAVLNGVRLYWVSLPNSIYALDTPTSTLVTLIFIFVCVNAVNLVDGLDGLSSGVVGIGASAMFLYTYFLAFERNLVVCTTASLVTVAATGVCLGFLPHNFHKARMFMGDSGSMLLGLLLASSSISFTGQMDSQLLQPATSGIFWPSLMPFVLPVAVMFVPLLDLVLSYIRRTSRGIWWFQADKEHLHHRLMNRGHSQRATVAIMWGWTALVSYGVTLLALVNTPWVWVVLGAALAIMCLMTWVYDARPRSRNRRAPRPSQEVDQEVDQASALPSDSQPESRVELEPEPEALGFSLGSAQVS